jgi:hypothetical protein
MTPDAVFPSRAGMVNGDTCHGPIHLSQDIHKIKREHSHRIFRPTFGRLGLAASLRVCCSKVSIPPKAVPTMTPILPGLSSVSGVSPTPPSLSACRAAATARWVKRSFDLTFLGLIKKSFGSNISAGTSLAIVQGIADASKRFTVSTLDFPSRQDLKKSSWPIPQPLMTPSPVTTTLAFSLMWSCVEDARGADVLPDTAMEKASAWWLKTIKRAAVNFIFGLFLKVFRQ